MSSLLGAFFEPLPTLQEDDELVALSTILNLRRGSLREAEIWAVCRECCLALRSVSKSSVDLFQKLCVTPDTLSFNAAGSVSFSDSDVADKDFQPPEFYTDGNTFKGHIFSLSRTLLEAAAHDLPDEISLEISSTLLGLLTRMSLDDPRRRPTLEEVTVTCNREIGDDPGSSKSICRTLSSFGRRKLSLDSQYEHPMPGGRRKSSSSSSHGEGSKQSTLKDNLPATTDNDHLKVTENGNKVTQIGSNSSSRTNVVNLSSMHGTTRMTPTGTQDKQHLREPPSPAALNNLSQRAQDILKKLYSTNESKNNNDSDREKEGSSLSKSPARSPNLKRKEEDSRKKDTRRSPTRSPRMVRKEHYGAKNDAGRSPFKSPQTGRKGKGTTPSPEEISSKLKELVLSRQSSRKDDSNSDQQTSARNSPDVQLRTILGRIPSTGDLRTGSPVGRRQSPSTGHSSRQSPKQSPRQQSPKEATRKSPQESQRKSLQSPKRQNSLRRRLSQKQLETFIRHRKNSGRSSAEIIEELEEDTTADDLDLILDDPWSDDEQPQVPLQHAPLARSFSAGGASSSLPSFQTSSNSVRRSASMKQTLMPSGGLSSGISLENISEEKSERTTSDLDPASEEDPSDFVTKPAAVKQKRSIITAETCQLDSKPSYNNIKELTQMQNQFLHNRCSSVSDFRLPTSLGSRATHFTPIVVTDKPMLSRAASSPTMDNAKAKARAALKAKLDMNKKGQRPPPELLDDLEQDALDNPLATPRGKEENQLVLPLKPVVRRHSSVDPPVFKRKISNESMVSVQSAPSRRVSIVSNPDFVPSRKESNESIVSVQSTPSRKVSTESNPDLVPSRKISNESTVSLPSQISRISDQISSQNMSSSVESLFAEVGNMTSATEPLGLSGESGEQYTDVNKPEQRSSVSDVPRKMGSLQTKVRTVSGSPITSKNSFSPIEPPQCSTDTGLQLKQCTHPVPQQPNQPAQVIGQMPSTDHQVKGQVFVKTDDMMKLNEQILEEDKRLLQTNQPASVSSSEKQTNVASTGDVAPATNQQTNVALSSSNVVGATNQPMRVSPSIVVNDQTILASPIPITPHNVQPAGHMSPNQYGQFFTPVPIGPVIGQNLTGQIHPQNMPVMGQMSPAQFTGNQPNLYSNGHVMGQGVVPGGSSPVMFNPAMMPGFSYQVQLQADPQTGLYRMVPVGLPIQGVPFHGSNGSLSGNSFGSPGSNNSGTPPQAQASGTPETNVPNNLHSYWSRQKNTLDTSSDGDSTCIPMSPEAARRAVLDRKKDQVKKRMDKSRYGTPPTKRSNAKTTWSSLNRNPTDSESSESFALAKPKEHRSKASPQVAKKKHVKGSLSDGDRKERIKDRIRERNELKASQENGMFPRSVSCDRLKSSPHTHSHGLSSNDTSGKSQEDLVNAEMKQAAKLEDGDDTRPLDLLTMATASPASVSSVSHDSGVNMRFNGMSSGEDMVLASQLTDALHGYNVVRRVMKLIRHAFAFDGYLENGVEDKEMAEYITSLAKLSWMTFSSAVTEKFCDLYWEEELLEKLYEAINGVKPAKPQPTQPTPTASHVKRSKPHTKPSKSHAGKTKPQKTKTSPIVNSKHPEEDDILSDLLPDDTFTSSSPSARHSRSTVKASLLSDSKCHSSDKKVDRKSKHLRGRSHSSEKSRSASRDRTKSKVPSTSQQVEKNQKRSDGDLSDGKKTAPPKPKRNPSPGIEPNTNAPIKRHDGKYAPKTPSKQDGSIPQASPRNRTPKQDGNVPKAPPRTRTPKQDGIDEPRAQPRTRTHPKDVTKTPDVGVGRNNCELPGEKQHAVKSNQIVNSESRESLTNSLSQSYSKESQSSSLSDLHFNSLNKSKDSFDFHQSEISSQLSDHLDFNDSVSSFEGPFMTSMSPGSNVLTASDVNGNRNVSRNSDEAPALPPRNATCGHRPVRSSPHQPHSDSSAGNSPAVNERISMLLQNALSRTDSVVSSSSTSSSSTSHFLKTSGDDSILSGTFNTDDSRPGFPNGIVYRSDGGIDPRIAAYTQQLTGAGETQNSIESKISDVEQQLMMEKKMRNKTDKFYQKLLDAQHNKGADHKTMLVKVGKQRGEMMTKIEFLESAKRHLEMLYAEQWGLDFNLLYSFATSIGTELLHLKECEGNQLLSFHRGRNKHSLQAGEPLGLFAFLFARQALLDGYLHHFFYTYHYFATAEQLLQFISHKFQAATGMYESSQQENRSKILCRAVDILQVWVEGFYEVDFRNNPTLLEQLIVFTTDKVIPVDPQGQSLLHLLDKYQREKAPISGGGWPSVTRKLSSVSQQSSPVRDPFISASQPRHHQDPSPRSLKMGIMACFTKKETSRQSSEPTYLPASAMDKDGFSLSQHTSLTLAQQLTLMQQDLFQEVHPVHYLNSRWKGIGVSTNNNSATTTLSSIPVVRNGVAENGDVGTSELSNSLFVDSLAEDGIIKLLLDHARGISHWVSAEILTCNSSKTQMALLSKFINTAKVCYDMRNFASCVQILDGLDNLIVRQVPAWRSLPSKVVSIYEDLSVARMSLQGDSESLVKGDSHHKQPTLPPTLLFLMHVQQLEIGGFQLANGLYKWNKIKSIAKLIDFIRIFQDKLYDFEADMTFQQLLKRRVADFHHDDIQVLAAQNSMNFHQLSSNKGGRRLHNAFQRVKANLQH